MLQFNVTYVQVEASSLDGLLVESTADADADKSNVATNTSAEVEEVLADLASTADVTEQQPASDTPLDISHTASADLPTTAAEQYPVRVTADVDQTLAELASSSDEPSASLPSVMDESAVAAVQEGNEDTAPDGTPAAEQEQSRVTADVDESLAELTAAADEAASLPPVEHQSDAKGEEEGLKPTVADLPEAADQQETTVTADVDQTVAELTSFVQEPAASLSSDADALTATAAEQEWQPMTADMHQAEVTADVDDILSGLTASVEEPAASLLLGAEAASTTAAEEEWQPRAADAAEVAAVGVVSGDHSHADAGEAADESQVSYEAASAAAATSVIQEQSSATEVDVGGTQTNSAADTSLSPESPDAADTNAPADTEQPANAMSATDDDASIQQETGRLTGDVDDLLAELMPPATHQTFVSREQQPTSENQSTAVQPDASPAAELQWSEVQAADADQATEQPASALLSDVSTAQSDPVDSNSTMTASVSESAVQANSGYCLFTAAPPAETAEALVVPAEGLLAAAADVQSTDAGLDVPLDRDYDQCLEVVMSELTAEALGEEQPEAASLPQSAVPAVPAATLAVAEADADGEAYGEDQFESEEAVGMPGVLAAVGLVALGAAASAAAVGMAASMAAGEAAAQDMPARPASPVASQLACAVPDHETVSSVLPLARPAAAAAFEDAAAEDGDTEGYDNDAFDTEPQEGISNDADQQLAGLERQVEQEDSSSSLSGASAESDDADDADGANEAQADFANDAYENDTFDNEQQQTEAPAAKMNLGTAQESDAENLMAMSIQPREPAAQDSGIWDSPAQASDAQDLLTQASDDHESAAQPLTAELAVPMPPLAYSSADVRPTRPSRAFMRRTSSLMKPKPDSRPGDIVAAPVPSRAPHAPPRPPQAPPAAPPRHRSRTHAPLVHQVSVSGMSVMLCTDFAT